MPAAWALDEVTTRAVTGALLAVPLGATEQHGPHLPLGTDTVIARALAAGLAEARDGVAVAPALPYGASGEHAGFAGTLSIGREALEHVLVELGRATVSAATAFSRLLFVCAHGGNAEPLGTAVRRLRAEKRDVRGWSPRWAEHAGRAETSIMLALAPERVGAAREVGNPAPLAELMPRLRAEGVRAVSPNGVLGDPTGASAAEGRELLTAAVADLAAFVAGWTEP